MKNTFVWSSSIGMATADQVKLPKMICKEEKKVLFKSKIERNLHEEWDNNKRYNIHAIEIPEVEGKMRIKILSTNDEFSKVN